ncbi:hypothetical protein Tco_0020759 [Tanacetum coccineum]
MVCQYLSSRIMTVISHPDMGNTDEPPVVKVVPKDWFKKPERPSIPDPEWNECKTVDSKPTQKWLSDLAKAEKYSKTFNDLISTLIDFNAFAMNRLDYRVVGKRWRKGRVLKHKRRVGESH